VGQVPRGSGFGQSGIFNIADIRVLIVRGLRGGDNMDKKRTGILAAALAVIMLSAAVGAWSAGGGSAQGADSAATRVAQAPSGPSAPGGGASPEKCQATCTTRSVACHQACSRIPGSEASKCVARCGAQFDACWSRCDGPGG
jgi:hypothetical protein